MRRIYDRATDEPIYDPDEEVPTNAVVIVDGCFLLREELLKYWTVAVYLDVGEFEWIRRDTSRDVERLDGLEEVVHRVAHMAGLTAQEARLGHGSLGLVK